MKISCKRCGYVPRDLSEITERMSIHARARKLKIDTKINLIIQLLILLNVGNTQK